MHKFGRPLFLASVAPTGLAGMLALLLAGCNGNVGGAGDGTDAGSGGRAAGTGGAVGSGGAGIPGGSGGAVTTGGNTVAGTGGASGSGGAPGPTTGGAPGSGGRTSTGGGAARSGGTSGGGNGMVGSGGAAGSGAVGGTSGGLQPFKGVANAACADLTRLNVTWWYNWTLSPGSCTTPEFVPMVAGKNEKTTAAVTTALGRVAAAGYKTVLGFNEPNKVDQANLTVAQVLDLWPALTANPAIRVSSPSTSADAQAWFTDFMTQAAARSLRIDFIALHWYGWNAGSCDAKALSLENYIKWAEAIPGNRPIWVTEWGCLNQSNPDPATVQAFYLGAVAMFARHPRIERYAWYPWTPNNELVIAGALTPFGTSFAGAPPRR